MKLSTLFSMTCLVGLLALAGCNAPATDDTAPANETAPSDSNATSSADSADAVDQLADQAAGEQPSSEAAGELSDQAAALESPVTDELATDELAADEALDDAGDDASELAEDTQEPLDPEQEFRRKLTQAMQVGDDQLAMQLMEEKYAENPDDMTVKVNYLALRVGLDGRLAGEDNDAAAQRFLETQKVAESLSDLRSEPQLNPIFLAAKMNEARAHAHQGDVDKAYDALFESLKGGVSRVDWIDDDPFFAVIRDNEQFQERLKTVWTDVAKAELDEFQSFDFGFTLPNLLPETEEPQQLDLSSLKGKVAIVDIWGTWCPPCRKEIPHFVQLQASYPDDLAIVGVNYENGEAEEAVTQIREFAESESIEFNYPLVMGDDETRMKIPNFEGFPTTLFLDRDGKVRLKIVGYHSYEKLEAYVKALLAEASAG